MPVRGICPNREKLVTTAGYYAAFIGLGTTTGIIGLAQQNHGVLGIVFTARSAIAR